MILAYLADLHSCTGAVARGATGPQIGQREKCFESNPKIIGAEGGCIFNFGERRVIRFASFVFYSMHYLDLAFLSKFSFIQPFLAFVCFFLWLLGFVSVFHGIVLLYGAMYIVEWVLWFTLSYPCYCPTPLFGVRLLQAIRYRECFHLSSFYDLTTSFDWKRIYGTFLWHSPLLSVSDATALRELLSGPKWRLFDRAWYEIGAFKDFLGGGLILARNAKWVHSRPTIARMFSRNQMQYFSPMIQQRADQMLDSLPEGVVDMQNLLFLLSFDVILKKCFGSDVENTKRFSDAFHTLLESSQAKMLWPFLKIPVDLVFWFLPIFRRGIAARKQLNGLISHHVREARKRPEVYEGTLLSSILIEGETNNAFSSDEQIADELLTLLFAGHVRQKILDFIETKLLFF